VSVPDKYASESTQEIQANAYLAWIKAKTAADAWKAEELRLREVLELAMGDADAATIDGQKVITHRYTDKIATRRLMEDYPDLTEHYMIDSVVHEFNLSAFLLTHGDIAEKYRVRSFRVVAKSTVENNDDQGS
jgi:hypothetical protein